MKPDFDITLPDRDGGRVEILNWIRSVCGAENRRDPTYYCIRELDHAGRHRYGIVIKGNYRVLR